MTTVRVRWIAYAVLELLRFGNIFTNQLAGSHKLYQTCGICLSKPAREAWTVQLVDPISA